MILKLLTLDGCSRVFEEVFEEPDAPAYYVSRLLEHGSETPFGSFQIDGDAEHSRMYRLSHMTTRQPGHINERVFVYVEVLDERTVSGSVGTIAGGMNVGCVVNGPAFQKRILRGK